MPVTVVVGGQFGSEGKGKVAHYLAREMHATYAVRCGGSNSGHTVIDDSGNAVIFRHLPTAALLPDVKLVICAGSYIDEDVLLGEISRTNITPERLFISQNAVIITPTCKQSEQESGLVTGIGSTGSGTGAAVVARIKRQSEHVTFAKDCSNGELKKFVREDVTSLLRAALDRQERIILEGTQGFGLSVLHSPYYPYVTSRDTTAAAFVAEAGLSPTDVDDVVLVIRAFPIRVAGDSGPLPNGTTWEEITRDGEHEEKIEECTSVTKKIRRVAKFDADIVRKAIEVNEPSRIVLNHVDYIHRDISLHKRDINEIINQFESKIQKEIDFAGISKVDLINLHAGFDGRFIPCGMLSSPQIKQYIEGGLLVKIPEGVFSDEAKKCFKSATYDMRLGDFALLTQCGKTRKIKLGCKEQFFPKVERTLKLLPNSLTFVTTHEEFKLTKDVIARFNLKGRLVHKGLLLGTGPIVDPEFEGKVLIPIHNFSSSTVEIDFLEPIISVEFTKTLKPKPVSNYINNPSSKGDVNEYAKTAYHVESAVFSEFNKVKTNASMQKKITIFSIGGAILAIAGIIIGAYQLIVGVNARMDNIYSIYTGQEFCAMKETASHVMEMKSYIEHTKKIEEKLNILESEINNIKNGK